MPRGAGFALPAFVVSLFLLLAGAPAHAGEAVLASRVWPAEDYTRVTLESARPIKHAFFAIDNPQRLVVDLDGVDLNDELKALPGKIRADDPYIAAMRVAQNRPGVVRVVFELKGEIKPYVFPLAPAGEYKHRLVLDIYPLKPRDPLLALVKQPDPIGEMARAPVMELPVAAQVPEPAAPAGPEPQRMDAARVVVPVLPTIRLDPEAGKEFAKPPPKGRGPKIDRLVIVAIDAGHGGEDPGAKGRGGTYEKDVTLAIARRLKARIDQEPGLRAVMVRDGDFFIPLANRVSKARRMQADLFVSIHADAWIKPDVKGSSVFALSERGATSAAARLLAQKENQADAIGGVNLNIKDPILARTLLDLSQTATINDSLKLGRAVLGELGDVNDLHKHAVEQAGFAVLRSPDVPSILVETAFISNPEEEKRLKDGAYQDKMAVAILGGIKRYLAQNPPLSRNRLAAN